ncbi:hypothetical protein SXCC_03876 [Gluconacetobacter sp. SXCC-1]|nr:hypothetical protein SXCC_03876 [Gluconacetobacter sp. SXCC-1]
MTVAAPMRGPCAAGMKRHTPVARHGSIACVAYTIGPCPE